MNIVSRSSETDWYNSRPAYQRDSELLLTFVEQNFPARHILIDSDLRLHVMSLMRIDNAICKQFPELVKYDAIILIRTRLHAFKDRAQPKADLVNFTLLKSCCVPISLSLILQLLKVCLQTVIFVCQVFYLMCLLL